MVYINAEQVIRSLGRECLGAYPNRYHARRDLERVKKAYPGYTNFTINSKPKI